MFYTIPDCGKGVNKDLLASELDAGVWSDCLNMRFRNGFAETWRGAANTSGGVNLSIRWMLPGSLSGYPYLIYSSSSKTYGWGSAPSEVTSADTEIKAYTAGVKIASMTAIGTTITVTMGSAHGRTTGDLIWVYDASPAEYNTAGAVAVTVIDGFSFTYVTAKAPTVSPATTIGAYHLNTTSSLGIGVTSRPSGASFNGVFVLSTDQSCYYFSSASTIITPLPGFGVVASIADCVRAFKNYVILLARTANDAALTRFGQNVMWSNAAEPGSVPTTFTALPTNDAGDVDLAETPGDVVDCLSFGDVNIVYLQDARYAMQYVGGNDVFSFTRLPGSDGLLYRDCVVNTPLGHVFITTDLDIKLHNGGESKSIADGRILRYLRENFLRGSEKLAFACVNPVKNEVWFCFPKRGVSSLVSRALVWSWQDDTWGEFDLNNSGSNTQGTLFGAAVTNPDVTFIQPDLFLACAGPTNALVSASNGVGKYNAANLSCTLTRAGMDFGDRNYTKSIQRSKWNFQGPGTTTATIEHGRHSYAKAAPTYMTSVSYDPSTGWANQRTTSGHYGALRMTVTNTSALGVGTDLLLRSVDVDFTKGGAR